jgi:hypothetical protein
MCQLLLAHGVQDALAHLYSEHLMGDTAFDLPDYFC